MQNHTSHTTSDSPPRLRLLKANLRRQRSIIPAYPACIIHGRNEGRLACGHPPAARSFTSRPLLRLRGIPGKSPGAQTCTPLLARRGTATCMIRFSRPASWWEKDVRRATDGISGTAHHVRAAAERGLSTGGLPNGPRACLSRDGLPATACPAPSRRSRRARAVRQCRRSPWVHR